MLHFLMACSGISYVPDGKQDSLPGGADSAPDRQDDTAEPIDSENHDGNERPVADAGPDQTVSPRSFVLLDGGSSYDPDGDPLTWAWTLTDLPNGSNSELLDDDRENPSFSPDVPGAYRIELIVEDGAKSSQPDEVMITVLDQNGPPVANAGPNQSVTTGDAVSLDGGASYDPEGDSLRYAWSFGSIPPGSAASLANAGSATPRFTADLAGTYTVSLTVSDGSDVSAPDSVVITASASGGGGGGGGGGSSGCLGCHSRGGADPLVAALLAGAAVSALRARRRSRAA